MAAYLLAVRSQPRVFLSRSLISINVLPQVRAPTTNAPTRFDQSFYKAHDSFSIPSDAQSVRSQATYASGLPPFSLPRSAAGSAGGPGSTASLSAYSYPNGVKRSLGGGTPSMLSQDLLSDSRTGDDDLDARSETGTERSTLTSVVAYSQADRMSYKSSSAAGSTRAGTDAGTDYAGGYKSGFEDDAKSVASMQSSSITDF